MIIVRVHAHPSSASVYACPFDLNFAAASFTPTADVISVHSRLLTAAITEYGVSKFLPLADVRTRLVLLLQLL